MLYLDWCYKCIQHIWLKKTFVHFIHFENCFILKGENKKSVTKSPLRGDTRRRKCILWVHLIYSGCYTVNMKYSKASHCHLPSSWSLKHEEKTFRNQSNMKFQLASPHQLVSLKLRAMKPQHWQCGIHLHFLSVRHGDSRLHTCGNRQRARWVDRAETAAETLWVWRG